MTINTVDKISCYTDHLIFRNSSRLPLCTSQIANQNRWQTLWEGTEADKRLCYSAWL